jgi:drug/metabolite transporter (DMT)-like permease
VAGLAVLVYPVAEQSMREPIGLMLAMVCALGWGAGTVYMKWARIEGDLLAITFWQIMVGVVVFAVFYLVFQGAPNLEPLRWQTWAGLLFNGILGTGFAYFIWFNIIGRLSTVMASLGSLINPVVGVLGAVIILGDRPTLADCIGFALIFSAAACVLLPQRRKPPPDAAA